MKNQIFLEIYLFLSNHFHVASLQKKKESFAFAALPSLKGTAKVPENGPFAPKRM